MSNKTDPIRRRRRAIGVLLTILVLSLLAPLPAYWLAQPVQAQGEIENEGANPRANYWRAVREGDQGYTAVQGQETGVLIQNGGENWRTLRNGPIADYGGWILAGIVLLIALFYLIKGTIRIQPGRAGQTLPRWTMFDRVVHWYVAATFLILSVTGLSLFYGREVLIPLLGKDGFAAYAGFAKLVHNYVGPLFAVGLVIMVLVWLRFNIPKRHDLQWVKQAGGMIGSGHPHAGRMNAGEKLWFWFLALAGLAIVGSGLVLDFPNYGQTRETMQTAHLVHAALGMLLMAGSIGHMYIGSIGTEGALEGMTGGRVDENWAKQHHDLWYDEVKRSGTDSHLASQPAAAGKPARAT